MNKWMTGTMVVGGLLAAQGAAQAQSSVQVYGLLSAGIGYTSDENGRNVTHALSGTNQNPRIGFRGQEDLGNGNKALFVLENGFNVMTGMAAQSGRLFGRQSFVGLSSDDKGTLTLGRQYEAVKDLLGPVVIASNGVHIGDNDNGYNNLRVQNAVKYVSPTISNFAFTGLYGFSENPESPAATASTAPARGTRPTPSAGRWRTPDSTIRTRPSRRTAPSATTMAARC